MDHNPGRRFVMYLVVAGIIGATFIGRGGVWDWVGTVGSSGCLIPAMREVHMAQHFLRGRKPPEDYA